MPGLSTESPAPGPPPGISPGSHAAGGGRLTILSATLALVLAISGFLLPSAPLRAQKAAIRVEVTGEANKALERGFSIPFDDRLADSLAKFDELVKAHAWDKAFRILADIPEEKWGVMLPSPSGFVRPASQRARDAILALPADGREAYRIFFDAKARLLFDTARTAQKEEDVKIARAVYDRYFITSVGDDAADRLADDYFERGQFAEAARCWQSIFEFHPDTNLPEAKIRVKRCIALFRAGLFDEFTSARQQLDRDFPGTKIVLGGRETVAADYFKRLESEPKDIPESHPSVAPTEAPAFAGKAPAPDAKPAWRYRFLEESDWAAIQSSMRNYYGAATLSAVVPAAAADGQRIYCNWLGACFALDAATGKIAWSSKPDPKRIVERLRANDGRSMFYTTNMSQFSLAQGKGVVLSLATPDNNQGAGFRLMAWDAVSGKSLWSSERGGSELARSSFIGAPLINGDAVLAVTHPVGDGSKELTLRELDLHNGKELWSLRLGTPQLVSENDWGQQFMPIPALALSGNSLYLLTDDGALLAIDLGRRRLEWAFKYDAPTNAGNGRRFIRMANGGGLHSRSTGPILVRDGVIYFKESNNPALYAVEESGPRLKWKWQDSDSANLVGIDERNLYLFSDELSAIDRTTPALKWSHLLPVELQGIGPRIGSEAILVFTSRGLFEISKDKGDDRRDVFRGADLGVAGGVILPAGKKLICVSNVAVTAYAEPSKP